MTASHTDDARLFSPSAARNREAILAVLRKCLPGTGTVLEIASGSGEHAAFFAPHFPGLAWQPSDPDPDNRASITAWIAAADADNLRPPVAIDATADDWGAVEREHITAIFCANMIHISPWAACLGLLDGAGRILRNGGIVCLYGPFSRGGEHTAPSNAAFDQSLRVRDPTWGVRDLDVVAAEAAARGFDLADVVAMPANNFSAIFVKR